MHLASFPPTELLSESSPRTGHYVFVTCSERLTICPDVTLYITIFINERVPFFISAPHDVMG